MIEINGKIYRNLQEQVEKNKDDIAELQQGVYTKTETDTLLNKKADLVDGKIPLSQIPDTGIAVDTAKKLITNDGKLVSADDVDNGLTTSLYNLGAFDTISGNVITRQTSEKWTWIPSQSIRAGGAFTYGYRLDIKLFNDTTNTGETKGISNWEYNFNMIANPNGNNNNSICVFNQHLYVFVNGATSESEARNVLDNNPPQLVYKLATPYTEEIIEGQPLITLDSQGSQWLRSEWEKGLNLFNGSRNLSDWNLIVGNTYTITTIDGTHSIKISVNWYSGWEEGDILVESTKVTFTYNEDRNWRIFIDPAQTQEHENFNDYGIMCVEGSHDYPYQPYNGAIVHKNEIYPVGSIYMSVNSTSPASLFGGTWEQLKDRFLIGAGNSYEVNATGGETTHTLTIEEMPKHYHQNRLGRDTASSSDTGSVINGTSVYSTYALAGDTAETGGSHPHNNMPPYLAVYMWKRTA